MRAAQVQQHAVLTGAHGPFFTRNILILTDSSGRTGVGEVPGGEKIRNTLQDAAPLIEGQSIGAWNQILNTLRSAFADRDSGGEGAAQGVEDLVPGAD
jgi:glucarate dehydratase